MPSTNAFPTEPKRRYVMRRNWSLEPEEHQLLQLQNQGRTTPHLTNGLVSREQFRMTVPEFGASK